MTSRAPSTRPQSTKAGRTTTSEAGDGDWVVACLEGRGVGREVGVVAIERDLNKVLVTQYADSPTFVKTLHLFSTRPPSMILVPSTFVSKRRPDGNENKEGGDKSGSTMFVRTLKDAWPDTPLVSVMRHYWNEQAGWEFLTQLILQDEDRTGNLLAVKTKYYALAASAALFKYLEANHSLIFPPASLRVLYAPLEGTCLIDADTAANLELVSNLLNKNSKQHLLGLLNRCYTPMATRLLKTNILGPLTDISSINTRLDAVEEMTISEERFSSVRKALDPLKGIDLDKLIGQIAASSPRPGKGSGDPGKDSETSIARVLQLRTVLSSLSGICAALQGSDAKLLRSIHRILREARLDEMAHEINSTINADALTSLAKGAMASRTGRIYAVRAEKKMLLDVARETYKENVDDAFEMCEQLAATHALDMTLAYSQNGFMFTCPATELQDKELPKIFTNVNKKVKKVEFSSLELRKKNGRINESVQEVFLMSNEIVEELLDFIRRDIACLFRAAEGIAMLDMLAAFADVSTRNDYVRPEWVDILAIKSGRHPLHEQFRLADGSFVPNDTYASEAASFQIVGGANMSGKSTLLKQIALLYVLAQIGCFVPAEYASFRVVYAILSRMSNDDSIESSMSTFSKEMSTMAMLNSTMQNCQRSLVLVDELGRGTSPDEGIGIAHALAENIIKNKALCFFATHFRELSRTLGRYPNVVSLYLETVVDVREAEFSMTFHHRVLDGMNPLVHYGLELAKSAKIPSDILLKAQTVSAKLEYLAKQGRNRTDGARIAVRRRELLRLKSTLSDLVRAKTITGSMLRDIALERQDEMVRTLSSTLPRVKPQVRPSRAADSDPSFAPAEKPADEDPEDETLEFGS